MEKSVIRFLESKNFKRHLEEKDKMILEFFKNSGIIVSCYESDDNEEKYELCMNYISNGSCDPELLFSGLTKRDLMEKFSLMYQICYNLSNFLHKSDF